MVLKVMTVTGLRTNDKFQLSNAINPYGDRQASQRTVQFLLGQPIEKLLDLSQ